MELKAPPTLVTTVNYGLDEAGGHVLELLDAQGKGDSLKLDDSGWYVLIRLSDETATATEWGLDLWRPLSSLPEVLPASKAFH